MEPIFTRPPEAYTRDIDILTAAQGDAILFLQRMTKQPLSVCEEFIKTKTGFNGELGVKDRPILCLSKETPGNRTKKYMGFNDYLGDIVMNNRIMSPTLAVYFNREQKPSIVSKYIDGNIKARSADKKDMFAAQRAGNMMLASYKDLMQTSRKLNNNAMSGAHVSNSTILHNKSAHSTLTSTCRTATSYGNANNEKFIAGNRHYRNPNVVKTNIISICRLTDMAALEAVVNKYNLHIPSVSETMDCIMYSAKNYWRDPVEEQKIRDIVSNILPIERCAVVYVSDMYHLAKYNPDLVRVFLGRLSRKVTTPVENPDDHIAQLDSDLTMFVSLLCAKEMRGKSIADVRNGGEKDNKPFPPDPDGYNTVAATAANIMQTLRQYKDLITALWVTDNMPSSVAAIPSILRRTAVVSDTDSTIFTVQYWTNWYVGKDDFSDESLSIAWSMIYLSSQLISHVLAKMSANMGIPSEYIHRIAMKNEYAFPVLSLTGRAKHYYAYISAREGNVYDEMDVELKGVALRNANIPPVIMGKMRKLICSIMDAVMHDGGLTVEQALKSVVEIEHVIKTSVLSGGYEYMPTAQVKDAASYSKGEDAPNFKHYGLWQEVFAPRYGDTIAPPYSAIKVSLNIKNKTDLKNWISRMEDYGVRTRMEAYCERMGKTNFTMILVPESAANYVGIPPEIIEGVDVRKIIFSVMESFYLVLESIGLFITKPSTNKVIMRLLTDYYTPDDFAHVTYPEYFELGKQTEDVSKRVIVKVDDDEEEEDEEDDE